MNTPDTESEPFVVVTDTTKMKWTVKELRELLKEEIRTLLENGATIATEEELSRSTPTDRKVRMTNTPDIEIEDVLDMLNSCVIMERDVDLQYAILDYKKAEQIIYHLLSSRDTYWKERVKQVSYEIVKEFQDSLITIAIKNEHMRGCVTSNQIIQAFKDFEASTHPILDITNEDNLK